MATASHPSPRILRLASLAPQPWRNGAGTTREIACGPVDAAGWQWRMSLADVIARAPFSAFEGIDRELVLVHGEGIRLTFDDDGSSHDLLPPHGRLRFAGERPLHGEPVAGPTCDFNLMWRRGVIDADLWHRPLVGTLAVFAEPGDTWALHVLSGRVQLAETVDAPLAAGDTLLLQADAQRCRQVVDGHGDALLIRLRPVGSTQAAAPAQPD